MIVAVDGLDVSVLDQSTVEQLLGNRVGNGSATLSVLRGGRRIEIVVALRRAVDPDGP